MIWLPIGSRLKRLSELEAARMELVIEGVAGRSRPAPTRASSPRSCSSLLPAHERDVEQKAA